MVPGGRKSEMRGTLSLARDERRALLVVQHRGAGADRGAEVSYNVTESLTRGP